MRAVSFPLRSCFWTQERILCQRPPMWDFFTAEISQKVSKFIKERRHKYPDGCSKESVYLCSSSMLLSSVFQSGRVLAQSITMDTMTKITDTDAKICAAREEVGSSKVLRIRSSHFESRFPFDDASVLNSSAVLWCSSVKWVYVSDMRSSSLRWQQNSRWELSKPQ